VYVLLATALGGGEAVFFFFFSFLLVFGRLGFFGSCLFVFFSSLERGRRMGWTRNNRYA
jgi:hypothetical protein